MQASNDVTWLRPQIPHDKVLVEVVSSAAGVFVRVNGKRVAGEQPLGGCSVTHRWEIPVTDVVKAMCQP